MLFKRDVIGLIVAISLQTGAALGGPATDAMNTVVYEKQVRPGWAFVMSRCQVERQAIPVDQSLTRATGVPRTVTGFAFQCYLVPERGERRRLGDIGTLANDPDQGLLQALDAAFADDDTLVVVCSESYWVQAYAFRCSPSDKTVIPPQRVSLLRLSQGSGPALKSASISLEPASAATKLWVTIRFGTVAGREPVPERFQLRKSTQGSWQWLTAAGEGLPPSTLPSLPPNEGTLVEPEVKPGQF